jgi:aspartyl-tRNA(Asn)/glutamyl-tRNA(Gln) amidotransferase subunit A
MPSHSPLSDWTSLSDSDRANSLNVCKACTHELGRSFHAVVAEFDSVARSDGPLQGMPFAAKDIFATGSLAPTWGCAVPPTAVSARAPILARLDRAGACLIATAELTELAYEPSGYNAARPRPLNPWNHDVVTGGSSSGSAVLVAAGCCYFALGSDTGGSVRIPSHCCGLTGLKPTWGPLPMEGVMPLAPSLDTVGILARSAADLALVWPVISDQPVARLQDRPRLIVMEAMFSGCDLAVTAACRDGIAALSAAGLVISSDAAFPEMADKQSLLILQAEAARAHRSRIDDESADPTLRKRLQKGLEISDAALAASLAIRSTLRSDFLSQMPGETDVALLPVMPIATPLVIETDPTSDRFQPRTLYAMSRFTRFVNYLGLPALAVPVGFDSRGMPIGLQMIGRPGNESLLLEVASHLQKDTQWHKMTPPSLRPKSSVRFEL